MQATIFIFLTSLSLFFIFFGYYMRPNADIFSVAGFTILFLLGLSFLPGTPGAIEYQTGKTLTTVDNTTTEQIVYTEYENFTFGFLLSVLSVLGFVNLYFIRSSKNDD